MCGIAGMALQRQTNLGDVSQTQQMLAALLHRGPDGTGVIDTGTTVLGSARLAIVDVAHGNQPFSNEACDIRVVFNGEIYNHAELRALLRQRGHILASGSDGEVIVHLYEEFGAACLRMLDGQFAIAISDTRNRSLLLARDAMGICPVHWISTPAGLYFCSEIKGLHAIGVAPRRVEPEAVLQMSYFGTICAPLTACAGVKQLPPAHYLMFQTDGSVQVQRYWSLEFPRESDQVAISAQAAIDGLCERLERAVSVQCQGEYPPSCFLSGGIDSAVIATLLSRQGSTGALKAFCATSDHKNIDEGRAARETAARLGLDLQCVEIDNDTIAAVFPHLIQHAEVPVISTEAAALMILAHHVQRRTKVVFTGEGADEALGGYMAFRQNKVLGFLTGSRLKLARHLVRPLLQQYYGSACLLPPEAGLDEVREHFGCVPAQAYEWEFYREALWPVLSPEFRQMAVRGAQWRGIEIDREALLGRHPLNRSLHVSYQVMLPNYLLGAHGDRIFAANSVEGRYPFLARDVVEYCAALPPQMKIRGLRDKYVLRRAAEKWLPMSLTQRPKRRFVMPFGTPFIGSQASRWYDDLLAPARLAEYGYFDPATVKRVFASLARPPAPGNKAKRYLERLALGLAANFVVSTQLLHFQFAAGVPYFNLSRLGAHPDFPSVATSRCAVA
jgi:asparagine synthase (glutamine-hydrolysing)